MQTFVDHILPSFQSLGIWGYWVLAFFVFLQGFALTSALSPATAFVVLAGALAAQGVYDLGDMIWFVGIADTLGAEISYRLGRRSQSWMSSKTRFVPQTALERSRGFFDKFGAFGLLIGRFVPMGAFVPLIAGITEMPPRRFVIWNIIGGFAYALVLLLVGYFFGSALDLISTAVTRLGLFSLVLVVALVLIWFLAVRLRRMVPFFVSIARSVGGSIGDNPEFRALVARHPRSFRFLAHRVSLTSFAGLPSSLFAVSFFYFGALLAGSILEFILNDTVALTDIRLANLFFAFRDPTLVSFFTYVTALGYWKTIGVLALGVSVAMGVTARMWMVPVLWVVLVGNQTTVFVLKLLFARPRPEIAVYAESSYSFPSGHAAVSFAFFGLLTYFVMRQKLAPPILSLLIGSSVIFLIGLSRLYLVEHYLSDVLNGYLVGALWAFAGAWFLEWRHNKSPVNLGQIPGGTARKTGYAVSFVTVLAAVLVVTTYQPERMFIRAVAPETLDTSVEQALADERISIYSETLTGRVQQPISIIILVRDESQFLGLFSKTDWVLADDPGGRTLSHAAAAAWLGLPYRNAPVTPSFWRGRPHDFAFERQTGDVSIRERHHARFWNSGYETRDGKTIFVGTASFDDRLKWGLTHHIAPNIDAERDLLVKALTGVGIKGDTRRVRLLTPSMGTNMTGDLFFTDGWAVLLDVGN